MPSKVVQDTATVARNSPTVVSKRATRRDGEATHVVFRQRVNLKVSSATTADLDELLPLLLQMFVFLFFFVVLCFVGFGFWLRFRPGTWWK